MESNLNGLFESWFGVMVALDVDTFLNCNPGTINPG